MTTPLLTWSKIDTKQSPPELHYAASVVFQDELFIHGGYNPSNLDDFWSYNFKAKSFQQVEVVSQEQPCGRYGHTIVVSEEEKVIYLFGGCSGSVRLNDLWKYNTDSKKWTQVHQSNGPSPRAYFVSFVHNGKLFVFGGNGNNGRMNDLHTFDFEQQTWTKIQMIETTPTPRHAVAWAKHANHLYLHGGHDGNYKSDFFQLNLDSFKCTEIKCVGSPPSPRYMHSALVINNSLYVLGGYNGSTRFADVFCYDFGSKVWTQPWSNLNKKDENSPSGRYGFVAQLYKEDIFVFGGNDGSICNDFYQLRLNLPPEKPPNIHSPSQRVNHLLSDLRSLVNDQEFGDVSFIIEGQCVKANKGILSVRSENFRSILRNNTVQQNGLDAIELDDGVSYKTFLKVMEYIYTSSIVDLDLETAMELTFAAYKYELIELKSLCFEYVCSVMSTETAVDILIASHKYKFDELKEYAIKYVVDNWNAPQVKNGMDRIDSLELFKELVTRKK